MTFTLEIDGLDNEAFDPYMGFEIARLLRRAADRIEDLRYTDDDNWGFALMDANGNKVGRVLMEVD